MTNTAHGRASRNYRKRLRQRGLARFGVLGLDADRKLIAALRRSPLVGSGVKFKREVVGRAAASERHV